MSRGLPDSLVSTAADVLTTGQGNGGLALLVLLADAQDRAHSHHFRTPTAAQRRRLGLDVAHVKTYCAGCGTKRGHSGATWVG